eukprot:TRINITY_DN5950_c0_g1_i1.p1 TRINITY_DN5950_c0_g1~~TRINITY_DN5950_c0_g1_i1.p1  ORF type:complete len:456 (-),score=30.08 TRINITY_DN5950_c0_g1_i1:79-1446(-)
MASPMQVLPRELLTLILVKARFNLKELLQISGVSKAFHKAARGIKNVELDIDCMTCASRDDCQSTEAYGHFLAQAPHLTALRLKIVDRHCESCKSAGNSCQLSEVFPAKWIESLRDRLEDFSYDDPYAFIINEEPVDIPPFDEDELTFTDFMLESLSRCGNLKRLELCTRKVFQHQGCSWELSFPNSLSELRLSNCSGNQLVGVLNRVSLTQACPSLRKLSFEGRLEGMLCLNFERLESLDLDLASRAEALSIDFVSAPSLQRLLLHFEEEHRGGDDLEDSVTLVIRHKLLSLTVLGLVNVTWEHTVRLLENSPRLRDFTFNQGVVGLEDGEMQISLTVMFQQLARSNPLLENLLVQTSKLPVSALHEQAGPSLGHLRRLRLCNLDIFDLLEVTKSLHGLLPNSRLLERVTVEVFVILDSESSEETAGLIDSMNSFFKLQRTFPGVMFELVDMES